MKHVFIVAFLLPMFALAAEIQAGFPSQAIWVSKTSAVEGETLIVSTVVLNGSTETLRATLVFLADGARISAREFELPKGESQIHSIEWKPKRGEHHVSAKIEGTSAPLSQRETPSIAVSVAEPPPPSAIQQAASQVVQTAGAVASSSLPAVLGVATNVFDAIEPLREKGVERLEAYLEKSRAGDGSIAGTSTSNSRGFETPAPKNNVLSTIAQTAAAAALFVMSSLYLFYPLLALLFFGVLYFLARRIRRRPKST